MKINKRLKQQLEKENGISEKNGNLGDTTLTNEKDTNADEKSNLSSINNTNEIKKTAEELLVGAMHEINSLREHSRTLEDELKKAKDQNDKLSKEKVELGSKLNETTKLYDQKFQLEKKQKNEYREKSKTLDKLEFANSIATATLNSCLIEQDRLEKENKKLKIELEESQKKIVNLECKNNKMDIVKANVIGMKRSYSSQSILAKVSKLKNEFNQEQGQKPALENGNMKQI